MDTKTKLTFDELDLSEEVLKAVKEMGFEEPSPIQAEAIPHIMEGKDIIGQAQTGTGKTAAFALPIIEKLNPKSKDLQAVILCPTRELVVQVAEQVRKIMKYKENLYVTPIYGGQPIERQLKSLARGSQVVVGTPGRTMDHINRGTIDMSDVEIVVLDEADEMLDMGFREDIEHILKDTPDDKQFVMFSATMEKDILELTKTYLKDPTIVNVINKKQTPSKIQQIYFEVHNKNKSELLARLIDIHFIKLALVFCNTKSQVDELVDVLKARGYFADALHGDMNQRQRDKVMKGFRDGTIEILVATDVAGRGIDVNNVEAVFNYDLPRDDEDYVHRIGRTGRAGKTGMAFSFVTGRQLYNLKRIERANGVQIQRQEIPSIDELEMSKINSYASKIQDILKEGHLSAYVNHIEMLLEDEYTSLDVAAALLKIIVEKDSGSYDDSVDFDELEVAEEKKKRNRGRGSRGGYGRNDRDRKEGSGDRKRSFKITDFSGKKRSFKREDFGDKKRSFDKEEYGEKKKYSKKESFGDKKRSYDKDEYGDKKKYSKKESFGDKKRSYDKEEYGEKKKYSKKESFGDKKRSSKKDNFGSVKKSSKKETSPKRKSDTKNKGKRKKKSNADNKRSFDF